jgi:tetratricopeptide (TPR) repeat protein
VVALLISALPAATADDVFAQADDLLAKGQAAEAESLLQEAVARQGPAVEVLLRLGIVQGFQSKYDDSEATFRRGLALAPHDPKLLHNLGLLFLRQERYDEALACFQQALDAQPSNPESNFCIGWIHQRRGDREEALRSYIVELNVNPSNANAWRQYLALRDADRPRTEQGFPWDMLAIWLAVVGFSATLYWLKKNYGDLRSSAGFPEEQGGPELPGGPELSGGPERRPDK